MSPSADHLRTTHLAPAELKPGPKPGKWERLFNGFVYFIEAVETGCVKIGYTGEPVARLRKLQTSSPHELRMIGHIKGTFLDEQRWHSRFAHLRVRGEWFSRAPDLNDAINEALR